MLDYAIRRDPRSGERFVEVPFRGALLTDLPMFNKGTAFPADERERLGLAGLLPPTVSSMETQLARVYGNYKRKESDLERFVFLAALQDRNETLFYRALVDHFEEMLPIVYTPTVGLACRLHSHIYRRARGIYLTPDHAGRIDEVLRNAPFREVDLVVVTDGERILGLGDLGAGGIGIAIGKAALYVAAAGIHPARILPIGLDVGTNSKELLSDPLYLGRREPRLRGQVYDAFLGAFVEGVKRVFPRAVLQWEDFGKDNAFRLVERFAEAIPSFDDDIQGTGAVGLAAILNAGRAVGRRLRDERLVFFGAGQAGAGIAWQILAALEGEGVSRREGLSRIWMLGSKGLLLRGMTGLSPHQNEFVRDPAEIAAWSRTGEGRIDLLETVRRVRPTTLVGTSGVGGSFPEAALRALAQGCDRPTLLALSNPTANSECSPEEALRATGGRALVATGSPFPPAKWEGRLIPVSQANNLFVFPGVGLGAIVSRARRVTDAMFLAAARALAALVPEERLREGALLPSVTRVREVAGAVAFAVGREAREAGLGEALDDEGLRRRIAETMWEPLYLPYRGPGE